MFVSRKYEQRRKKLRQSLAWWEDQELDVDGKLTRKKIFFKEQNRRGSANLDEDGQNAQDDQVTTDETISRNLMRRWKKIRRV